LVREAVTAEPVPNLRVKGKVESVGAWRLLDVARDSPGWSRHLDSPLIGRNSELELLHEAFDRSARANACELVTLMGAAGVGKSRLAQEFLSKAADAVNLAARLQQGPIPKRSSSEKARTAPKMAQIGENRCRGLRPVAAGSAW
jgi:hypothetical protein